MRCGKGVNKKEFSFSDIELKWETKEGYCVKVRVQLSRVQQVRNVDKGAKMGDDFHIGYEFGEMKSCWVSDIGSNREESGAFRSQKRKFGEDHETRERFIRVELLTRKETM